MASAQTWLEVLAWTKALFEATTKGIDLYGAYRKYTRDRETLAEASRVSVVFSTFSEAEVAALLERLEGCRDRFVEQGGGAERTRCICSILNEARRANGGTLPLIDDWQRIYSTLNCKK
jgi:hypothetical protein